MAIEIELKFALQQHIIPSILQQLSGYTATYSNSYSLTNDYYDTPENDLRQHDIGLRVRTSEKGHEMTLKGKKQGVAGIQQRAEWNITLPTPTLDITQLPIDVWPEGLAIQRLQTALQPIFSTHFKRQVWRIMYHGCCIEVALDQGEIIYGNKQLPILELELELITGNQLITLLEFAEQLLLEGMRLSDDSKAARGYRLALALPIPSIESQWLGIKKLQNESPKMKLNRLLTLWQSLDDQIGQCLIEGDSQIIGQLIQEVQFVLSQLAIECHREQRVDLDVLQSRLAQLLQRLPSVVNLTQFCASFDYQQTKLTLLKIAAIA